MYKALISFCTATKNVMQGQVIELTDQDEINDLTEAGYIEEYEPEDLSDHVRYRET